MYAISAEQVYITNLQGRLSVVHVQMYVDTDGAVEIVFLG